MTKFDNSSTPITEAALVIFGKDEGGRAHASQFGAADAELAIKAAGMMGMRALRVTTDEHRALASGLPAGKIFQSGRGFVPFAKEAVHERLDAFNDAFDPPAPADPTIEPLPEITGVPCRWADIGVGHLVLASLGPGEGWYEGVITEDKGDDLFELRWRDWPDWASFVRTRGALSLLSGEAIEASA